MAFSIDDITSSASNLINDGVKFVGDGVSSVTEGISSAFGGNPLDALGDALGFGDSPMGDSPMKGHKIFQYPSTLAANSRDTYESDPEKSDGVSTPGAGVSSGTSDPFIFFSVKEISTTMKAVAQKEFQTQHLLKGALHAAVVSTTGTLLKKGADAGLGKGSMTGKVVDTGGKFIAGAMVLNTVVESLEVISKTFDDKPLRNTRARMALYMPAAIQISDHANYDPVNRANLAKAIGAGEYLGTAGGKLKTAYDEKSMDKATSAFDGSLGKKGEGQILAASMAGETVMGGGVLGGAASWLGFSNMAGAAALGGVVSLVGDEEMRMVGKVLNPNEYSQFKSTNLRQFSLGFKFLPDSVVESNEVQNIIKTFREALYPIKHSNLTMTVPDTLEVSFHNVAGMVTMPEVGLINVDVTYNPNAASFFKHSGQPVEITMNITMQELYPIHRDEVTGGM